MVSLGVSHIPITSGSDAVGTVSLRDVLMATHDGNITGKLSDIASKSMAYYAMHTSKIPFGDD